MWVVTILLRLLAGALGLGILYLALFIYEDEEKKLQTRLEQIWHDLRDREIEARKKPGIFTAAAATYAGEEFDAMFGRKLLSLPAVSVSVVLALSSIYARNLVGIAGRKDFPPYGAASYVVLLLGTLAVWRFLKRPPLVLAASLAMALAWCFLTKNLYSKIELSNAKSAMIILGVFASVIPDIGLIALLRRATRHMASGRSALLGLVTSGGGLLLALGAYWIPSESAVPLAEQASSHQFEILLLLTTFASANLAAVLIASFFFGVSFLMIFHPAVWPVLARIAYPLQRYRVIENKKWLFGAGCFFMLMAWPALGTWLGGLPGAK